jgi:DHA1 family inner membrane transport protein
MPPRSLSRAIPSGTPTARHPAAALVVLSLTALAFVTSEVLPYGLLSLIAVDLGRPESEVGLLVTAHALGVALFSIPLAHATRHIPRRTLLPAIIAVFIAGTLVVATASSFVVLVVGRVVVSCAHATFWAVVTATAAGLFPSAVRGRTVAHLLIGPSLAGLVGLPAATWLAQRTSWNVPFFVVAGLAAVLAVAIVVLLPYYHPREGSAARGTQPSTVRFAILLGMVFLAIVASNATFTFITPFLRDVTGFSEAAIPAILLCGGVSGLVGMLVATRVLDAFPRASMGWGLGLFALGWGSLGLAGGVKPLAVVVYSVTWFGFSVLVGAFASRVLVVSPGSTDLGIAAYGTAYNSGGALGALLGAGVFASEGPAVLPAVTTACLGVALLLFSLEPRFATRRA